MSKSRDLRHRSRFALVASALASAFVLLAVDFSAAQVTTLGDAGSESSRPAAASALPSNDPLPSYVADRDWTPELEAEISAECAAAPCFIVLLDSSESPFEQLARIAESDSELAPKVIDLLQGIKKKPGHYLRDMPIENEAVLLRHVQDAIAQIVSTTDKSFDDTGDLRNGGTAIPKQDPLEFAQATTPGASLGSSGLPYGGSIESPWRWVLRDRQRFGYATLGGSYVGGTFSIDYLISLSGFNARFRQKFQIYGHQMQLMLTGNYNSCTVDLRRRLDRPCQNQPNPDNGMYVWSSRITQPRTGLHNVYDNSYERKFFKFWHTYMLRNDSLPNAISPEFHTFNGPSPRYECRREWSERYRCRFE